LQEDIASKGETLMLEFVEIMAAWAIPFLLLVIPVIGWFRRLKVYEVFVEGATEGFHTAIRIMPFLLAMMVAIGVFKASGAMEAVAACLRPLLTFMHVPAELVPLAIMRPLSGTGALGITTDILQTYGPDSMVGRMASTILASTDTTLYILTIYFGAVGIKNVRYSAFVGIIGDLVGFMGAIYICHRVFGS
jgi:spore maturation protein B